MSKPRSTLVFQEMKPEDAKRALEGHVDILKPAIEEHQHYFSRLSCVRCGGEVMPVINSKQLFRQHAILPNFLAECRACGTVFEPYTRIEVSGPKQPQGL